MNRWLHRYGQLIATVSQLWVLIHFTLILLQGPIIIREPNTLLLVGEIGVAVSGFICFLGGVVGGEA